MSTIYLTIVSTDDRMSTDMMMLDRVIETFDKVWGKKMVAYILADRLCYKHMRELIKKTIPKKDYKNFNIVQLAGICSSCRKSGFVYYLEEK